MINENWIRIPGFSHYEINEGNMQIRSDYRSKEPRILKPCYGYLKIKADNGEAYAGSIKRFLFAAQKGIDARDISQQFNVIETSDGKVELIERSVLNERIREKMKKRVTVGNVTEEYLNAIQFCAIVLQAYRTGDYSMVITEIESRKGKVVEYIKRHGLAINPDNVRELWEAVLDIALTCIVEKKTYIVNLTGYLNSIARSYTAQRRNINSRLVSIDSGNYQYQKYL